MSAGVVALYCRLSRDNDEGVENQEAWGRKYAEDHWPGVPVEVFADRGISASNGDVRPGLERFLEWLAAGRIAHVWAVEQSRLSRETEGRYTWFKLAGEMVIAGVTEVHTNRNGTVRVGDVAPDIQAVLNAHEARVIRVRTREGKDRARETGNMRKVSGGVPPLGYRDGAEDWETEPGAARLLRDVAERVLADPEHVIRAAYQGAMSLAEHREVRDAAGRPVTEKMLRAALQRPVTAGLITARDDPGRVTGRAATVTDPPLSELTWRDLRQVFAGRKRGRRVSGDTYWAGPVFQCGKCGNPLSGVKVTYRGPLIPYYACRNPHPRLGITEPCRGVSIRAEDVHQMLRAAVEGWAAASPDFARSSQIRAGQTSERDRLAAELAERRRRFSAVAAQYDRGAIDDDTWNDMLAERDAAVARIEREMAGLTATLAEPPMPAEIQWDELPGAERLALASMALVTPIRVAPGNGGGAARTAAERVTLTVRA